MIRPRKGRGRAEDGVALLLVVGAPALVGALAAVLVLLVATEEAVEAHQRRALQARYAAEAGLAVAVAELEALVQWREGVGAHRSHQFGRPAAPVRLADGSTVDPLEPRWPSGDGRSDGFRWRLFGGGLGIDAGRWSSRGLRHRLGGRRPAGGGRSGRRDGAASARAGRGVRSSRCPARPRGQCLASRAAGAATRVTPSATLTPTEMASDDGIKAAPARVLIVVADPACSERVGAICTRAGHEATFASTTGAAIDVMASHHPDLVITAAHLDDGDPVAVIEAAKGLDAALPVIALAEPTDAAGTRGLAQAGALDVLLGEVDESELLALTDRALARARDVAEAVRAVRESKPELPEIVGRDPALTQVLGGLERAAGTDATVLLEGESGTGKELFARTVHGLSARLDGPFVAINCAAIPETLLESELFGHEKGAFTGAVARKPGKFEVADGGTLFLDEIGDLPGALQAKILRAVEHRTFERIGGTKSLKVDVRLVAATNRDLRARVAAREFREDLFFRLSVFPIQIPPLRERTTDIPLLARYFIERCSRELDRPTLSLSKAAEDRLIEHDWPGNVRELQNCVERSVILCEADEIGPHHLDVTGAAPVGPAVDPWEMVDLTGRLEEVVARAVAEVEKRKIVEALDASADDTGRAADMLAISHRALLDKMSTHGLTTGRVV